MRAHSTGVRPAGMKLTIRYQWRAGMSMQVQPARPDLNADVRERDAVHSAAVSNMTAEVELAPDVLVVGGAGPADRGVNPRRGRIGRRAARRASETRGPVLLTSPSCVALARALWKRR